ncbi:MAG: PCRF domain-containing protein [Planctomycetota bacterium]
MDVTDQIKATLAGLARERDAIEHQLLDPQVLSDHHKVRELSVRKAALDPVVEGFRAWQGELEEAEELRAAIEANEDTELVELATAELPELEARAASRIETVLADLVTSEDRAVASIMVELRAGVGGDEAGLWAGDLVRMYEKFAESRGWSLETLSAEVDEGLGGVRSAVLNVRGEGVFAELAHEAGTHCVKRVPATETQGRIHTSTATVAVLPEPREVEVTIDPADVDEHITTAQGPGGQNVNKVATAVHLIHRPSGVEVRMQETKSQAQNREKAWRLLRARVYEIEREKAAAEAAAERRGQIGTGGRAERIRTYRFKDSIAVDHRLGVSFPLSDVLSGGLGPIVRSLIEMETARRLAQL